MITSAQTYVNPKQDIYRTEADEALYRRYVAKLGTIERTKSFVVAGEAKAIADPLAGPPATIKWSLGITRKELDQRLINYDGTSEFYTDEKWSI